MSVGSNARLQAAEQPHVLVVEVDVDVAVELARLVEELAADAGMRLGEAAQDRADVAALDLDDGLPPVWARRTGGIFTFGMAGTLPAQPAQKSS